MKYRTIIRDFNSLNPGEFYRILHARQEVFALEQDIKYQDLDFIDQKSIHLFFEDTDHNLISYLRIIAPGVKYPEASIGRVLTMPEYRRKGFGRELMLEGIKESLRRFDTPIKIEAQEYLVDFYKSLNFRPVSPSFILEGISHVEMIL